MGHAGLVETLLMNQNKNGKPTSVGQMATGIRLLCLALCLPGMLSPGLVLATSAGQEEAEREAQWWEKEKQKPSLKLHPPALTTQASRAQYEQRRSQLLIPWVSASLAGNFSDSAIAKLYQNKMVSESNLRLRALVESDFGKEVDFAACDLARAYYLFRDGKGLEPETQQAIRDFFLKKPFKSAYCEENKQASENHEFLFHTARYLMAQALPRERFAQYGKTGAELVQGDRAWLASALRYRGRYGWGEFDSTGYSVVSFNCLASLYDFSADAELKRLSGMMMDLLLAGMAVDSLSGMYGGAHGRIYYSAALNHGYEDTMGLQYLYFGNLDGQMFLSPGCRGFSVAALTSTFRPNDLVVDLALSRTQPYENLERKQLHKPDDVMPRSPLPGSIRKYTFWTSAFVMGCVQFQDAYPVDYRSRWYAHHQQHEWDLTFGTRLGSRIFTQHPSLRRTAHGYWTGDLGCCCGHFFQNKGALVALYDIPVTEECQWIHAFVPKEAFDEVVEENGFIFLREGNACAALKLLAGYHWTKEGTWSDVEVISQGGRNGVVCEAGLLADFGDFSGFRREIAANQISWEKETGSLTYRSKRAGTLYLDTKDQRKLGEIAVNLEYPLFGSPFMNSRWGSGIIEIKWGERKLVLDFTR
jgi:hypothetical protein